jgi:hypothetical protein
VMTKEKNLS